MPVSIGKIETMSKSIRAGLFFISFALLFFAVVLLLIQQATFKTQCAVPPNGSTINDFPISAEYEKEIAQIETILASPLELSYGESVFQVSPEIFLQVIDSTTATSAVQSQLKNQCSSDHLINYLAGRYDPAEITESVVCSVDKAAISTYLQEEIIPRYAQTSLPIQPIMNEFRFEEGKEGIMLDLEPAVDAIAAAACSFTDRVVDLPLIAVPEPKPSLANLEIMLQKLIDLNQDPKQLTEIYFYDFRSNETLNFARRDNADFPAEVAFTAASTIKLPVLISSFIRLDQAPTALIRRQMELMITESKNDQTDWLMSNVIGGNTAPLLVTEDLRKLGFTNTFLAGYFYSQAPLLDLVVTPANQRTDSGMRPDIYNQTTPKEIGELMKMVYQCDMLKSGPLLETFPNQLTTEECGEMTTLMKANHLPYLITAGLPEQTVIAHKHGWTEEADGLLHTMSNVAAVYTPGGDYVLTIFTNHPVNLIFEKGNILFSSISAAVYSYFNPDPRPEF